MSKSCAAPRRSRYRVCVADCPWVFDDPLPGKGRGAATQYATLSTADIINRNGFSFQFPLMAPDSILFMWRVSSQVEAAYEAVRAWGYEPNSEIVWRKVTKKGKRWIGMGRTVRAEHETCIIATRGRSSVVIRDSSIRSVFDAPVPTYQPDHPKVLSGAATVGAYIHSAKPEEFACLIERMCRGPYVELFARPLTLNWSRNGWRCFGNEIPGGFC